DERLPRRPHARDGGPRDGDRLEYHGQEPSPRTFRVRPQRLGLERLGSVRQAEEEAHPLPDHDQDPDGGDLGRLETSERHGAHARRPGRRTSGAGVRQTGVRTPRGADRTWLPPCAGRARRLVARQPRGSQLRRSTNRNPTPMNTTPNSSKTATGASSSWKPYE